MKGDDAVFIPGADHAGFETWVVYERELEKQGKTRFDYSRDELTMLQLAAMHLGNTYANFFFKPPAWHGYAAQLDSLDWPLTDRENQILALIMEGKTPKAVAEELGISRETVYKHVSHMHAKLGVTNEAELTARAREELRNAGN